MKQETIYFSSRLYSCSKYKKAAERIFEKLDECKIPYELVENTSDIWMRDFMPVNISKPGDIYKDEYVSFRYEPWYLDDEPWLRTNYKYDISDKIGTQIITYSIINLDGGNVVLSPSKNKVIVSDRIYEENNCGSDCSDHVQEQKELLETLKYLLDVEEVIVIKALNKKYDMTGHADGMVRFVDENTVVGNDTGQTFEQDIKDVLATYGISVIDFPYYDSKDPEGKSAIGLYINFLETEEIIFLPVFGNKTKDEVAIKLVKELFEEREDKPKKVVPVNINEIAEDGGVLNCISWERLNPNNTHNAWNRRLSFAQAYLSG